MTKRYTINILNQLFVLRSSNILVSCNIIEGSYKIGIFRNIYFLIENNIDLNRMLFVHMYDFMGNVKKPIFVNKLSQ